MHRQRLELAVDHQAEQKAQHADAEPADQERAAVDADELGLAEVRQLERRLPAPVLRHGGLGLRDGGGVGRLRRGGGRRGEEEEDEQRNRSERHDGPGQSRGGAVASSREQTKHLVHVTSCM